MSVWNLDNQQQLIFSQLQSSPSHHVTVHSPPDIFTITATIMYCTIRAWGWSGLTGHVEYATLPETSEVWSLSALGLLSQVTNCATFGTRAHHLGVPVPSRTQPPRARQPGGSGAKPCSLSATGRTVSIPPYRLRDRQASHPHKIWPAKWRLVRKRVAASSAKLTYKRAIPNATRDTATKPIYWSVGRDKYKTKYFFESGRAIIHLIAYRSSNFSKLYVNPFWLVVLASARKLLFLFPYACGAVNSKRYFTSYVKACFQSRVNILSQLQQKWCL